MGVSPPCTPSHTCPPRSCSGKAGGLSGPVPVLPRSQPSAVTWLSQKEGPGELGEPFREATTQQILGCTSTPPGLSGTSCTGFSTPRAVYLPQS